MTAARMWARADLKRRWRSWAVLGLLAGISVGIACAGIAGARRTDRALPAYTRLSHVPDVAVLANDANYATERAKVDRLPQVKAVYPFIVPFTLSVASPKGMEGGLLPVDEATMRALAGITVDGRQPDPARADEMTVNQASSRKFDLHVGSTVVLVQAEPAIRQRMRVVGITHSPDSELDSWVSSGFYEKYSKSVVGFTNEFVDLKRGKADFVAFQTAVQDVLGRPVNVDSAPDLFGVPKIQEVSNVEEGGLLLFSLVVLLGAGALVGQALVRAVSAGAVDLPTWRALGADRRSAVYAMVAPATVTAVVGAIAGIVVAIALSPRFPIALTRRYDIDVGVHADWFVLLLGALGLVVAIGAAAWITAELRVRRGEAASPGRPSAVRALSADLPPALLIGSRLAIEPGRGRRAVPVRSAMVGAIVGVLGFVGCLTFRSGLSETVADPTRSGIVWDYYVASDGKMPPRLVKQIADDPAAADVLHAPWARAITVKGRPTPMFGTDPRKGHIDFVMLEGHAPRGPSEIVFAPQTAKDLDAHVGDVVRAGQGRGEPLRVVGIALLPATSHSDYDKSAWVTNPTLTRLSPPAKSVGFDFVEDYVLVRFRPGADVAAATKRLSGLEPPPQSQIGLYPGDATLPTAVISLGDLRALPFALAVFFALLASATVAHALVTTVRRRASDLAILRSIGFTRRDARVAIAWQSTLLALVGLLIGVPLGIIAGRLLWKQLAENFPVVYVPPLALVGVLLVVPIAIAIANALAAGPAYAATRMRPAEVLRSE